MRFYRFKLVAWAEFDAIQFRLYLKVSICGGQCVDDSIQMTCAVHRYVVYVCILIDLKPLQRGIIYEDWAGISLNRPFFKQVE